MPATVTFTRPTLTDNDTLTAAQFNALAVSSAIVPSATAGAEGVIQLAGGLAGTAASPVVAGGHITLARQADMATDSLIGRATAGAGVPELIPLTAAGRALIAAISVAAMRALLELPVFGTMATQAANAVAITGGSVSGLTALAVANAAAANLARVSINKGVVALTDAASIATNLSLGNAFTVTLAGNRTLANPTNIAAGASYAWAVTQDATGSRTLAFGSAFKWQAGAAPLLTTTAGAVDIITGVSFDGTAIHVGISRQSS